MDLEKDYVEFVIQFSVALFAVSAAYFINPSNLLTLGVLLIIPVLFGYTAYISRNIFRYSSFLGFIAIVFAPLNYTMAAVAIIISLGNVLVSFFAGGTDFKDYYRATMLPLLLTGLVLGGAVYLGAIYQPDFGNELRTGIADTVGNQSSAVLKEANLAEMQQDTNQRVVKQVSQDSIRATQGYVINRTQENLTIEGQQAILQAFSSAQEDVPALMLEGLNNTQSQTRAVDISERVSGAIENLISGKKIIVLIPLITFGLYGLQPLFGILTALFAKFVQKISSKEENI